MPLTALLQLFSLDVFDPPERLVVSWHFSLQVLCEDFDAKGREYISTKESVCFLTVCVAGIF